jgi:hypothetical protein
MKSTTFPASLRSVTSSPIAVWSSAPGNPGGKKTASKNNKIGNVNLKWAFSEAACLFLRDNQAAQKYHDKLISRYGKPKAMAIIAKKLGRSAYAMLKRKEPFDVTRFFQSR